jgi:hypothetical protein
LPRRNDKEERLRRLEKQASHGEEFQGGTQFVEREECRIDRLAMGEICRIPIQIKPQWMLPMTLTMRQTWQTIRKLFKRYPMKIESAVNVRMRISRK